MPDAVMTEPVHDMLAAAGLAPGEHAADAGYAARGPAAGRPGPGHHPARPRCCRRSLPAGPRRRLHRGHVHHRLGRTSRSPAPRAPSATSGHPYCSDGKREIFIVGFPAATCRACPARGKCTTSARHGRQLSLRPREIHEAVTAARAGQASQHWKDRYKIRAGVEGTIAPGHPRHRHPHRPLPRPAQNQPRTRRRRRRDQPDPARRLVDQQPTRPDPDHPPPAAQPRRLSPISQQS